jgi:hypothetical protein
MRKLIIICCSLLFIASCKKDEGVSDTPSIEFISISPNPAIKYQDEITISIKYKDGNGDLGENTPDVKNLFVTDKRNNVTFQFRVPQLSPDNSDIIIQGELDIKLSPQGFVDDAHTTESATYEIYIVDRAGNQSNKIETTALTINQ